MAAEEVVAGVEIDMFSLYTAFAEQRVQMLNETLNEAEDRVKVLEAALLDLRRILNYAGCSIVSCGTHGRCHICVGHSLIDEALGDACP